MENSKESLPSPLFLMVGRHPDDWSWARNRRLKSKKATLSRKLLKPDGSKVEVNDAFTMEIRSEKASLESMKEKVETVQLQVTQASLKYSTPAKKETALAQLKTKMRKTMMDLEPAFTLIIGYPSEIPDTSLSPITVNVPTQPQRQMSAFITLVHN